MAFKYVFLIIVLQFGQLIAFKNENESFVEYENYLEEIDNNLRSIFQSRQAIIFPGTKWCGQGNISRSGELGLLRSVDQCCKNHDECDKILPGESKNGLTNNTPFTKLNCACDDALYNCLKNTGYATGTLIKTIYVAGQPQCYREDYPIVGCNRYKIRFFMRRCVDYKLDTTQPKRYQYFDLPFFDF